jgi:hypothetical protein
MTELMKMEQFTRLSDEDRALLDDIVSKKHRQFGPREAIR